MSLTSKVKKAFGIMTLGATMLTGAAAYAQQPAQVSQPRTEESASEQIPGQTWAERLRVQGRFDGPAEHSWGERLLVMRDFDIDLHNNTPEARDAQCPEWGAEILALSEYQPAEASLEERRPEPLRMSMVQFPRNPQVPGESLIVGMRHLPPETHLVPNVLDADVLRIDYTTNPAGRNIGLIVDKKSINNLSPNTTDLGFCTPDAHTLCLVDGRYEVKATWVDPEGTTRDALANSDTVQSGSFSIFDKSNRELFTKVLPDGCKLGDGPLIFSTGLTNLETLVRFTDTVTDETFAYRTIAGTPYEPLQTNNKFRESCNVGGPAALPNYPLSTFHVDGQLPPLGPPAQSELAGSDLDFLFAVFGTLGGDHSAAIGQALDCEGEHARYRICDTRSWSDRSYLFTGWTMHPDGNGKHGNGPARLQYGAAVDLGMGNDCIYLERVSELTPETGQPFKIGFTPINANTGFPWLTYALGDPARNEPTVIQCAPMDLMVAAAECRATETPNNPALVPQDYCREPGTFPAGAY